MEAKQKAFKIIQRMGQVPFNYSDGKEHTLPFDLAKQYALVAVDFLIEDEAMHTNGQVDPVRFWKEVKHEIEKYEL